MQGCRSWQRASACVRSASNCCVHLHCSVDWEGNQDAQAKMLHQVLWTSYEQRSLGSGIWSTMASADYTLVPAPAGCRHRQLHDQCNQPARYVREISPARSRCRRPSGTLAHWQGAASPDTWSWHRLEIWPSLRMRSCAAGAYSMRGSADHRQHAWHDVDDMRTPNPAPEARSLMRAWSL